MMKILILIGAIICAVNADEVLYESKFLFNNEKWQITGNNKVEPAVHQSYNINREMAHYIMFKDNLINVDSTNSADKTLWYFESPEITINPLQKVGTIASANFKPKYPKFMSFTMTGFVGDFLDLNADANLVKIKNKDNCFTFKANGYDGKTRTFNVSFNSKFWRKEKNNEQVTDYEMRQIFIGAFTIEILGDWTRDCEVIGLDNVIIYM